MVGENFGNLGSQIPKNAMKTHEICKFDRIIASSSTMNGENFENLGPHIPKSAMKTHEICKLSLKAMTLYCLFERQLVEVLSSSFFRYGLYWAF